MLNLIYSLQAKFYTMSSIHRPCSMGLFVSICINKDLFDVCSMGVGDKCISSCSGLWASANRRRNLNN